MLNRIQRLQPESRIKWVALLFAGLGILLLWWRLISLSASYDQGIFLQVLWNGIGGNPFESTLSSQLSTNVIHSGEVPSVAYQRLSQHFTPILITWIPLVRLLGIWALPVVQISLITGAGLVLFQLAKLDLSPNLAERITVAFYCANAIVAPTLSNFTDLCQLPLLVFALLYGLKTNRTALWIISALLIPLIREDTGVVLASIGLWLSIRDQQRRTIGLLFVITGLAWVGIVTNVLMPIFGDDNSKRFMVSNFGQFAPNAESASSFDIAKQVFGQPLTLLRELVSPPGDTLMYFLGMGLPLLFVPLISADALLMASLPLLGLLLARGSNDPLSINIRYTFLVVPGLFAGTSLWWRSRQNLFNSRKLRKIWAGCIALSLIFAVAGNQNRSFSFLIPDSIHPWVYQSPLQQWEHGVKARQTLQSIPANASVSANTNLIPWLAQRQVLVRFPHGTEYQDINKQIHSVDWVAIDLKTLAHFSEAFSRDRERLKKSLKWLDANSSIYRVQSIEDGVVVLNRNGKTDQKLQQDLNRLIQNFKAKTMPPSQR
ncbi:DUF2079 domain-containing protein [Synechococcus sp. MU1655]|uniref:DUF2079 domain-containing protein n=1 Tax=Synechococcus sp. MU1655 TaxID=2508355 RepID=UPI0020260990|nr:DUF2079 domain-containing protein [Synechococcus sp. MU1655]